MTLDWKALGLDAWQSDLETAYQAGLVKCHKHGHRERFESATNEAPAILGTVSLDQDAIALNGECDNHDLLQECAKRLMPWRKGPFSLADVFIDCEWRSNVKFDRIANCLDWSNKRILDVGCGSGYYMYRLANFKPAWVLGADPTVVFYYQFQFLQHYFQQANLHYAPMGIEAFALVKDAFDIILNMGILYHRKEPVELLKQHKQQLAPGGSLLVETLTYPGEDPIAFYPEKTYAKMSNVHWFPTVPCLERWLQRAGFSDITHVDTTPTTIKEQRKTDWIEGHSLESFLDPSDHKKTVEGYPGPQRSIMIAKK